MKTQTYSKVIGKVDLPVEASASDAFLRLAKMKTVVKDGNIVLVPDPDGESRVRLANGCITPSGYTAFEVETASLPVFADRYTIEKLTTAYIRFVPLFKGEDMKQVAEFIAAIKVL